MHGELNILFLAVFPDDIEFHNLTTLCVWGTDYYWNKVDDT